MKLEYFDLLSPDPIYIHEIGGIISPRLRDISSIGGINTYQYYLTILLLDSKTYFAMAGLQDQYNLFPDEEKTQLNIYDLLTANKDSAALLQKILNFFIKEEVVYITENKKFLVQKDEEVTGTISKETYPIVCDVIFQRNCIKSKPEKDLSEIKNKKALEIMKKLQKGRTEKAKHIKADKNMELGNIISAVANKSQSLNILNIWDLTVYQVWDCFTRLSNNSIYDIQSMSVATWGNKDNYFDATAWFKRIDPIN